MNTVTCKDCGGKAARTLTLLEDWPVCENCFKWYGTDEPSKDIKQEAQSDD